MSAEIGRVYEYVMTVEQKDLASSIGSGGQDVLATPVMITWMEIASLLCLDVEEDDLCSLGVNVNIDHIAGTPLGSKVTVKSTLTQIDDRRYTFSVEAFDETEKIGGGTHIRAVTKTGRFMEKVNAKKNNDIKTSVASLKGKSILTLFDHSAEEINHILDLADDLKSKKRQGIFEKNLANKNIALIFEKSSTRTRCAFTVAASDEGAHAEYLGINDIQLGKKETVEDTARVLGRMFDGIQFRGFSQDMVNSLAKYSGVPVWNGLTDLYHPTQALADVMTIKEKLGGIKGVKLCYIGDGRNNVANSLMIISSKLGMNYTCISPETLQPDELKVELCKGFAEASGGTITVSGRMSDADGVDVIYTDVWCSMGEEDKAEDRVRQLSPFQVDEHLMKRAAKNAIFMHCLPAVRGNEVTAEVLEGKQSVVFDQAENRLHTIKAIMVATISGK